MTEINNDGSHISPEEELRARVNAELDIIKDITETVTFRMLFNALDENNALTFGELQRKGNVPSFEEISKAVQEEMAKHEFPAMKEFYDDDKRFYGENLDEDDEETDLI